MYVFIFYFLVLENISTYVEQVNGSQVLVNVDQKSCKRLSIFSNKLVFFTIHSSNVELFFHTYSHVPGPCQTTYQRVFGVG